MPSVLERERDAARPRRSRRRRRPRGSAPARARCRGSAPRRARAAGTPPARAARGRSGRPAASISARIERPVAVRLPGARRGRSRAWRAIPCRVGRSVRSSSPSIAEPGEPAPTALASAPASSSAPSSMSPADAADAVEVEDAAHSPHSGRARDPRRDRARAEAVVDVHDRDARRARARASRAARSCRRTRRRSRCSSARRSPARRRARRPPTRARRPGPRRRPRSPRARRSSSAGASRCSPATPASACTTTLRPEQLGAHARLASPPGRPTSRRTRSSRARAPPARRAPPTRAAPARPPRRPARPRGSAARASSSARVTSTLPAPPSSSAGAIASISSGVLPSARIASGAPWRSSRSVSTRAKPRSRKGCMGSASATTGSVRCRHAATAGRPHPRAQAPRRAVALRASTRRGAGRRRRLVAGPLADARDDAGAGQLQRPLRRRRASATTSATSGTRRTVRVPARLGGRAGRAALRRRDPPRRRLGRRRSRSPSTRAATRRSRPTSPRTSRAGEEHRITVVVNNRLTWQSIPPGIVEARPTARRQTLLPRLLQLRRPAPRRSGCTRTPDRRTSTTSPS